MEFGAHSQINMITKYRRRACFINKDEAIQKYKSLASPNSIIYVYFKGAAFTCSEFSNNLCCYCKWILCPLVMLNLGQFIIIMTLAIFTQWISWLTEENVVIVT